MKKPLLLLQVLTLCASFNKTIAQDSIPDPDTVKVGIYIVSIHDIDFKQKEFTVNFWIWLKYKNRAFRFNEYLEVPNAKTVNKSFFTADSSGEKVNMMMKLQCTMKDSWRIANFPFDRQNLRISIENSQYDSSYLVFQEDTVGEHFDRRFTLRGWRIDSCLITTGYRTYETGFGDESLDKPQTKYAVFRTRLSIMRDAGGIFWKMFLGMYIAFLIAYICFFIHSDGMDSRFGLSVGALFAVVGNKYIIDSSLPESTSFTLVDTLHGLTLFCIFAVIACTAYSLWLVKQGQNQKAHRFDRTMAIALLLLYIGMNIWFISEAASV